MSYTEDMEMFERGALQALLSSWPYMTYDDEQESDQSFQEKGFTVDDVAHDIDYYTFVRECDNFFRVARNAGIFTAETDYAQAGANFLFGRNGDGAGFLDYPAGYGGKENADKLVLWCDFYSPVAAFYNPAINKIEVYYG